MGSKILCVIPCRKGSKRLPDKTIRLFKGKPLLDITIEQARSIFRKDQVIVNTDYELYPIAYTKYKRPDHLCGDDITTEQVLQEMMPHYPDCEMVVLLQVTSPNRSIETIKKCIYLAYDQKRNVRTEYLDKADGQCYVWWTNKPWDGEWLSLQGHKYSPDINTQLDFEIAEVLYDI